MPLGEVLHALLSEINRAENLRVLRFEAVEDAMKAATDLVLEVKGRLSRALQLTYPSLKRFVFGGLPPVAINHCIAQQSVEPGHSRLAGFEIVPVFNRTEICGLQDVFGERNV